MKYIKQFENLHNYSQKFEKGDFVRMKYDEILNIEICEVIGFLLVPPSKTYDYLVRPTVTGGKVWCNENELDPVPECEIHANKYNL
jgi:hypothetical protein